MEDATGHVTTREFSGFAKSIFDKIETGFKRNADEHLEMKELHKKTNGRITKLEQWKFMILGGFVAIQVVLIPVAIAVFKDYISK